MIAAEFSLEELLAELESEPARLEGYRTLREWAAHLGVSEERMRRILVAAQGKGRLLVAREARCRIDGQRALCPVYAFRLGAAS